jgi:hypothetical protein
MVGSGITNHPGYAITLPYTLTGNLFDWQCFYSLPDVLTNELVSLNLLGTAEKRSILLLDQTESLVFFSDAAFCERLGCDPAASIKVVSIIGKLGFFKYVFCFFLWVNLSAKGPQNFVVVIQELSIPTLLVTTGIKGTVSRKIDVFSLVPVSLE